MTVLHIRQGAHGHSSYSILLTLWRDGRRELEAEANIQFALTAQEQEDIRWYLEDYLQHAATVEAVTVDQIETLMTTRGEELYAKVLTSNGNTQALWFSIRNELADLRVEITTGVAEAASIPWELMRDPKMDSPISLRVKAFVRVQSNPNISFVTIPPVQDGRIRLLYIACRPRGSQDVELRAVANRLLQDLGADRVRFDIKALRPPTFKRLQKELLDAKAASRPYHIVHFDGHGVYADLSKSNLADWLDAHSDLTLGGRKTGKHGYLLFEHPSEEKVRPVDGQVLGQLLHDNGVPVLVLNACQSAMHESDAAPETTGDFHDEVRAIGSLAQAVVDQGIPAVLGMRYSVYVDTAAAYIGKLYAALAGGRSFGEAATEGRKHLQLNPERWIGLQARSLQDWIVPIAYEARSIELCSTESTATLGEQPELDPVQFNRLLLRHVPEEGFVGRDETILALDRAFDDHRVVLLHAYAGQGKSSIAVEFARWYSVTGGLGAQPLVLLASFESHADLADLLNQIGQLFSQMLAVQGIDWSAINEPDKRRQRVLQILCHVPMLFIWDNVEPVSGFPEGTESQWTRAEQKDLRDFLHQIKLDTASKAKVLLTSRRNETKWLGGIPYRIPMPPMKNSDAARLALNLGKEKSLKLSEIADWQPLLDYCCGNPLTLRVLVEQAVKAKLRGRQQIMDFVEAIRSGEQQIEDADEKQGRDRSLGASLDYGFRHAFKDDELPIVALLHLFQSTVNLDVLAKMGRVGEDSLPELKGRSKEYLAGLLERAKDTGLLTQHTASFTVHPALPWFFRELFARHYDGQGDRSRCQAALRAWVAAVSGLAVAAHHLFNQGHRRVVDHLELEEANLLHARRLSRRNEWWGEVLCCMQGLHILYYYQGRTAEWARLVEEIRADYFTDDDEPIRGREDLCTLVMDYRAVVAESYERNLAKAAALQEKQIAIHRQRTVSLLALPLDAPLDDEQRSVLHSLANSIKRLGDIQQGDFMAACEKNYQEAIAIFQRIQGQASEADAQFGLGNAYLNIPAIRDLDAAEMAYQRGRDLYNPNDALSRSKCIAQIGTVHHERFREAHERNEPEEVFLRHASAAEENYQQALQLCPKDSLTHLAPTHGRLGTLYAEFTQFDRAREHYEMNAHYCERIGDRLQAGTTRFNMAVMYFQAAKLEDRLAQKRANLLRAQAYVEAALRDFEHYQGRAVRDEAKARSLAEEISQALTRLPQ